MLSSSACLDLRFYEHVEYENDNFCDAKKLPFYISLCWFSSKSNCDNEWQIVFVCLCLGTCPHLTMHTAQTWILMICADYIAGSRTQGCCFFPSEVSSDRWMEAFAQPLAPPPCCSTHYLIKFRANQITSCLSLSGSAVCVSQSFFTTKE